MHWFGLVFRGLYAIVLVTLRRWFHGRKHPNWRWRTEVAAEILRNELGRHTHQPLPQVRSLIPNSPVHPRLHRRLSRRKSVCADRQVEIFTPNGWTEKGTTVLYLHGGGYVVCGPRTHRDLIARVAVATQARCIAPVYSLAPEAPCPQAVEEMVELVKALLRDGLDPARLVFAGDSAGGGLALSTMIRLRESGVTLPAAAILLSPWLDLTCTGESIDRNGHLDYLQRPILEHYSKAYLQDTPADHPLASPLHADLQGLPPLLLFPGDIEAFHSESLAFAERAQAADVELTLVIGEGMIHVWPAFASLIPEARSAFAEMARFLDTQRIARRSVHSELIDNRQGSVAA